MAGGDEKRQEYLRYLWIDSLCIVQDSKRDWEEQYAQISRIYQGALVAIAAAAAPDCGAGFLRPRAQPLLPDPAVEIAPGGFATTCTASRCPWTDSSIYQKLPY
ncbi:hypothetical protein B0T26DRAFT_678294 [Lasiosphaeria miniovina]|uniref:Heterokaryon incompatibility domain-containing protein n=1 Tax=Lasiosphaeria miniovina TaxID=1954250 RepID=A0AA40ADV3_9PEZI|nr:uncharacterized protein B0T26DRAFT_678294 [Lasiosphaeria miniovina]KAK0714031.1 hypothetical protein B0T26DRAFT_678294 [Lasiosphaeria miniovina]